MSWPGFYSPASAWLFLLLLPLVLLYFLKLKRPQHQVPSLALWHQVLNDQRVNSPFQKFKRNLLLLLQLLLLACLILAAMQPFLHRGAERARYIPVLVDCSASMAAINESGESRLDLVKARIEKLIDDLLPDQKLSLIAMGSSAQRLTSFTDNQRLLRETVRRLEVQDVTSNLDNALRLAQALRRSVPIDTVLIYSDGNLPDRIDFELPFQVNYQRVEPGGPNLGIASFNARRANATQWNVFVRLQASNHAVAGKIELFQDGQLVAEDYANLEPEAAQRLVFRIATDSAASLEIRLTPDDFDSLASDNTAGLRLPESRPLAIYCPTNLSSFRHALESLDNIQVFPVADSESAGRSQFDLYIGDAPPADGYSAKVQLQFGRVPKELEKLATINSGAGSIVDWRRNSQFLRHVQLNEVLFSDEAASFPNTQDSDYEKLGFEILAEGRDAPMILKQRSDEKMVYHLLFHPDRSTLPYRVGFPVLVANLVDIALREAELSQVNSVRTGVLPPTHVELEESTYQVSGPKNYKSTAKSDDRGVVAGIAAPHVGTYTLRSGDDQRLVDVGLLSSQETSLKSVEELQFRELSVGTSREPVKNDRPLWPWFALAGFGLLLGEWWYFNRRPTSDP